MNDSPMPVALHAPSRYHPIGVANALAAAARCVPIAELLYDGIAGSLETARARMGEISPLDKNETNWIGKVGTGPHRDDVIIDVSAIQADLVSDDGDFAWPDWQPGTYVYFGARRFPSPHPFCDFDGSYVRLVDDPAREGDQAIQFTLTLRAEEEQGVEDACTMDDEDPFTRLLWLARHYSFIVPLDGDNFPDWQRMRPAEHENADLIRQMQPLADQAMSFAYRAVGAFAYKNYGVTYALGNEDQRYEAEDGSPRGAAVACLHDMDAEYFHEASYPHEINRLPVPAMTNQQILEWGNYFLDRGAATGGYSRQEYANWAQQLVEKMDAGGALEDVVRLGRLSLEARAHALLGAVEVDDWDSARHYALDTLNPLICRQSEPLAALWVVTLAQMEEPDACLAAMNSLPGDGTFMSWAKAIACGLLEQQDVAVTESIPFVEHALQQNPLVPAALAVLDHYAGADPFRIRPMNPAEEAMQAALIFRFAYEDIDGVESFGKAVAAVLADDGYLPLALPDQGPA